MVRKIDVGLRLLLAVSAGPLILLLPSSTTALLITSGLVAALNASLFALLPADTWALLLHSANGVALVTALFTLLRLPTPPPLAPALSIAAIYLILFLLGALHPARRFLLPRLAVQQFGLVAVLVSWLVLRHFWPMFIADQALSSGSFVAGLRALFAAPLMLVLVVCYAVPSGWPRYSIMLAGVCAGQWSIAFFELGAELRTLALVGVAFIFGTFFVVLVGYGLVSRPAATANGPV
jgi:hypothetical protein